MKNIEKVRLACALLRIKLLKKRIPLIVSWSLTYRCNHKCLYCGIWEKTSDELSNEQIFSLIDQMAAAGTQRIHFTGGEPLLRDDIDKILIYCKKKGISTALNSNGFLIPEKIKSLINLDLLSLSLDGPEAVHDSIRGKGSYQQVMGAIEAAKKNNIKIKIITVLSKLNLGHIDFILHKAQELKIPVTFQPTTISVLEGSKPNSIAAIKEEYNQAVSYLIKEKRKNKYIGNSCSGLKHLYDWPSPSKISCVNSRIICRLEPDGRLYGCNDYKNKGLAVDCITLGFKKAFDSLVPFACDECWCASLVELNCLFAIKLDTVFSIIKLI
ncbi:MAG: radical SAM protein [Candidatus Omnitrophica bacterium]|nr:radical SAM protein [Candidatus Omnitrophota bacterium]